MRRHSGSHSISCTVRRPRIGPMTIRSSCHSSTPQWLSVTLFCKDEQGTLDQQGYEKRHTERGFAPFQDCSPTDGHRRLPRPDISTSSAIHDTVPAVFRPSSRSATPTSEWHSRSALRMGLHRSYAGQFNPIEAEIRKRVFWIVRKLDIYVGAMLGLPQTLSDDDIDQGLPSGSRR